MNQLERINFLIRELCNENEQYRNLEIPFSFDEKVKLLRSLMNVRSPRAVKENFLKVQDEFLTEEINKKGIIGLEDISTISGSDKISLWQGDITRLRVDAIVNAANSQMLGCFIPCHGCIDNIIHYTAGVQLRNECFDRMNAQGHKEATGKAKITKAYNLPCKYVLHTVGPIVLNGLTKKLEEDLKSCYQSCLELAVEKGVRSIVFCCISTGEFHFPNDKAAKIAVDTVNDFIKNNEDKIDRIIFNVFKDIDMTIYRELLKC